MGLDETIISKVCDTLIEAGSTFSSDKYNAYKKALEAEDNPQAKWVIETIIKNAEVAKEKKGPLCDDTGIPHIVVEIGENSTISGNFLDSVKEGVRRGLELLPGRPMAITGNDYERIGQMKGISSISGDVEIAPILVRTIKEEEIRIHILMFGGGPAIRAKTYRVFHKHDTQNVIDAIVEWGIEGVNLLGCTPCTLAVGIGRSHYEASAFMLQALVDGNYHRQSAMEKEITDRVNENGSGALGLGGKTTVLGTFVKVGAQRSSGVRIVCVRPCCCMEPRIATCVIDNKYNK